MEQDAPGVLAAEFVVVGDLVGQVLVFADEGEGAMDSLGAGGAVAVGDEDEQAQG
ncbi:hypothetical protein [Streptomyces sp. YKOK-I1]